MIFVKLEIVKTFTLSSTFSTACPTASAVKLKIDERI